METSDTMDVVRRIDCKRYTVEALLADRADETGWVVGTA